MSLDQQMDILREDIKIQDAKVEKDIRKYADLLSQQKEQKSHINSLNEIRDGFKRVFEIVNPNGNCQQESKHLQELKQELFQTEASLEETERNIEMRQKYYLSLKNKDYDTLWNESDEDSLRAAVYYVYGSGENVCDITRKFAENIGKCSQEIVCYLLEKAIVVSESEGSNQKLDLILRDIVDKQSFASNSKVGAKITKSLYLRERNRLLYHCRYIIEKYNEHIEEFETCKETCIETRQQIEKEVKKLQSNKLGKDVENEINKIKQWYKEYSSEEMAFIKEEEKKIADVRVCIKQLKAIKEMLEKEQDSGSNFQELEEIDGKLDKLNVKKSDFVSTKKLKQDSVASLKELERLLRELGVIKANAVERQREIIRVKVEKKEKRKKYMIGGSVFCFILIIVIIGCINSYPVLVKDWKITGGNGAVKIPQGAETVSIIDRTKVEQINIPEGVKSVLISNCSIWQETIKLPTSIESIQLEDCWFMEHKKLTIDGDVREIKISEGGHLAELNVNGEVENLELDYCRLISKINAPKVTRTISLEDCELADSWIINNSAKRIYIYI